MENADHLMPLGDWLFGGSDVGLMIPDPYDPRWPHVKWVEKQISSNENIRQA